MGAQVDDEPPTLNVVYVNQSTGQRYLLLDAGRYAVWGEWQEEEVEDNWRAPVSWQVFNSTYRDHPEA